MDCQKDPREMTEDELWDEMPNGPGLKKIYEDKWIVQAHNPHEIVYGPKYFTEVHNSRQEALAHYVIWWKDPHHTK